MLTAVAAAVAAAAATLVPLVATQAQSGPAGAGHSAAGAAPPGPPTLAGVYSGAGYGFSAPNSIAADHAHVWVLNGGNDSVTELDADTGAWTQTLAASRYGFRQTGSDTTGIVDDGSDVWVGNLDTVTEINAGDSALVRVLRIPARTGVHGWPTAMVRSGSQLWGATPETCRPYCGPGDVPYASLLAFDASDGRYERVVVRKTAQDPIALASDGTSIWFAARTVNGGAAGSVTEFSAASGRQLWSAPAVIPDTHETSGDSIVAAGGRLWVANGRSVTELNASDGTVIRVLSGERYHFTGQPVLAVAGSHVFVVNGEGSSVTEIDARTGALAHLLTAARYHLDNPVGIAAAGHRLWILNSPTGAPGSVVELAI